MTLTSRSTPETLMRSFAEFVRARDLDSLVDLYEPNAVFEPEPGVVVEGVDAIRKALAAMLALEPELVADTLQVLYADEIALVVNEWTMTATAPDGTRLQRGGRSSDVLRRQADGTWLVLIDRP